MRDHHVEPFQCGDQSLGVAGGPAGVPGIGHRGQTRHGLERVASRRAHAVQRLEPVDRLRDAAVCLEQASELARRLGAALLIRGRSNLAFVRADLSVLVTGREGTLQQSAQRARVFGVELQGGLEGLAGAAAIVSPIEA